AAADVLRDAAIAGIARGALYEAKGRLGVVSVKQADCPNGGWEWSFPEPEAEEVSEEFTRFARRLAAELRESVGGQAEADAGEGAGGAAPRGAEGLARSFEDSKNSNIPPATTE